MLLGDLLNPGNCFKLALVPIPGMIRLPEPAEFRRKATLLRRIAVFVFAAQKPPGERIERNHRETFFLFLFLFCVRLPQRRPPGGDYRAASKPRPPETNRLSPVM